VTLDIDFNGDHLGDGKLKARYSYLDKVTVANGAYVAQGDQIATSGTDTTTDDQPKLGFNLRSLFSYAGAEMSVRPDKFFRYVTDWDEGSDTSFISQVYCDANYHSVQLVARTSDLLAPAEAVVFHRKDGETLTAKVTRWITYIGFSHCRSPSRRRCPTPPNWRRKSFASTAGSIRPR